MKKMKQTCICAIFSQVYQLHYECHHVQKMMPLGEVVSIIVHLACYDNQKIQTEQKTSSMRVLTMITNNKQSISLKATSVV